MSRRGNPMTKEFIKSRCRIEANGCWIWQGTVTNNGYGQVVFKKHKYRPHRVVLHLWKGFDLKSDLFACHTCDTKLCCNPEHLFEGTGSENMQDCKQKGRLVNPIGEHHGQAILSNEQAREVKRLLKLGLYQTDIAAKFGVSRGCINSIKRNITWKWLEE